jgi:hypothetical protein
MLFTLCEGKNSNRHGFYKFLLCISDNVNTRTALEHLRELIGTANIYMANSRSNNRTPNRMILKNIAGYITDLFKVIFFYYCDNCYVISF